MKKVLHLIFDSLNAGEKSESKTIGAMAFSIIVTLPFQRLLISP